jgi:hypothetical protein
MCGLGQIRLKEHPNVTAPRFITGPPASICALNPLGGDEQLRPRARTKVERSSWLMSMSLRLRCLIASPRHRAAYLSVEIETQFGPALLPREQRAKTTGRPWRRRE